MSGCSLSSSQIDELGRSTSGLDGIGICWSVSETLLRRPSSYTLLATHLIELCQLAVFYPTVTNLHLQVDASARRLHYRFKVSPGLMSTSIAQYGIEVGQISGFPSNIISDARVTHQQLKEFVAQQPTTMTSTSNRKHANHKRSQHGALVPPESIVPPTPIMQQPEPTTFEVSHSKDTHM